jgi:hypothetical protein
MTPTINIYETDPDTGYSVANHLLAELETAGDDGLSAAELAYLVGEERPQRIAAWLRDLRAAEYVYKRPVSPGSTRVRWYTA